MQWLWRLLGTPPWATEIIENQEELMATAQENQATIDALATQADKAKTEIVEQIGKLEQAAAAGQVLDFKALRSAVGGLDELNPDAVVETGSGEDTTSQV